MIIGQTISHYTILEKLGEGGMGVVYKAHDAELDRDVALKFLPNFLTSDPKERERFYHEARAASALNHPNISTIYEIKEFEHPAIPGTQLYLAMEYVEGRSLRDIVGEMQAGDLAGGEESALTIERILDIAIQACEGLAAAHEKGIVHRDIKSANLMLTPKGRVKIMDFGLAKVQGATKLTMTGSTIGTAAYMSPEQARGEELDQRTDIFSFGVVLYELLAGRLPFRGEHPAALMYSIVNEEPQPITKFNEKVTPGIEQIVARALAKNRGDRYQNVDELLSDLRVERKRPDGDTGYATTRRRSFGRPKRPLMRIGIAATAVVLLVVLAIIFNPFNLNLGVQKNIAEPKPSLAVISFENIPDPADRDFTGALLTDALITALFETKDIDVISRERLFDIQKDIGEGDSKVISPTVASQISRRAGVSTMMLASIIQLQPTLTVTYRVIDVESGKIINTKRVTGYRSTDLLALVDTLALMVKSDLNVVPSTASARSVMDVSTRSPEAYRAYLEGVERLNKMDFPGSHLAMQKAIALDSTFALPHYQIGLNWSDQAGIRRAWGLRANATEKDRLLIEALYLGSVGEDPAKAAQLLEQILQTYPREQSVYFHAAGNYVGYLCDNDRAIEVAKRGLQRDSTDTRLWNILGYYLAGNNQRTEALYAADTYVRLAPAQPNPYDTRGDIFYSFGEPDSAVQDWKEALRYGDLGWLSGRKIAYTSIVRRDYKTALDNFRKVAAAAPEDPRVIVESETVLVSVHRGELGKARRLLGRYIEDHRRSNALLCSVTDNPGLRAGGDLADLLILAYEEGDYASMLRYARERHDLLPTQRLAIPFDPTNPIYGRYEIAWALLKLGKMDEYARLMADLKNEQRPTLPKRQQAYDYYAGLFALERGEFDSALERFRKSLDKSRNHEPQYHYAVAMLKTGRTAEAIAEFRRLTWWPFPFDLGFVFSPMYTYWPIAAVKAHYWLGVAYEQQGKRVEAIKEYETFLDTWKNADFKSAEMQDARVRLTKLTGGKK